jgi:hypothetical protein
MNFSQSLASIKIVQSIRRDIFSIAFVSIIGVTNDISQ